MYYFQDLDVSHNIFNKEYAFDFSNREFKACFQGLVIQLSIDWTVCWEMIMLQRFYTHH